MSKALVRGLIALAVATTAVALRAVEPDDHQPTLVNTMTNDANANAVRAYDTALSCRHSRPKVKGVSLATREESGRSTTRWWRR